MRRILIKAIGLGLNLWGLLTPRLAANTMAKTFSKPPKYPLRPKVQDFLAMARQIHHELAGQNIVEYHWGPTGAPLVLLSYGWGANAGRWRHYVPELIEAGYHVLAYDPPGHGLAPSGTLNIPPNSAIICALLEYYGPAHAIVGHSFGGGSYVNALNNLPHNLHPRRMVLMGSFSFAMGIFQVYKKCLGIWSPLYRRMIREFEKHNGNSIDHYDFALMTAGFSHIEGLLAHDPSDPVTPYAESCRYHTFWTGSYLYSPSEGGHHLGTAGITRAILRFIQSGEVPAEAEREEQSLVAGHDLGLPLVGL